MFTLCIMQPIIDYRITLGLRTTNQSVERMAAGGRRSRVRPPWAATIAHFFR